jgi:hypothetical protein
MPPPASASGSRWSRLLATPAPRGAWSAARSRQPALIGLATLLLTLLAFKLSAQFAGAWRGQLDVSLLAIGKMLLILLPLVLIGTALLTFLAAGGQEHEGSAEPHDLADAAADDPDLSR